jgi:hypothetical protein
MRRAFALAGVAGVAALTLAACNDRDHDRGAAVGGICKAFPKDAAAPADPAAAMDDCLHRWGYALARTDDDAATVAHAVLAACTPQLTRWNQQALTGPAPAEGPGAATSLITGESTTPIGAHADYAQGRALLYVIEGRAGRCPPPKFDAQAAGATTTTAP